MAENIYPIFEKMLQRKDREALLKQKGIMIWFTGWRQYPQWHQ